MWPHLYTPTGLRVGAPQTRNIEYLGYLRSKSYEKRLKTIVIDRPTKNRIWHLNMCICLETGRFGTENIAIWTLTVIELSTFYFSISFYFNYYNDYFMT